MRLILVRHGETEDNVKGILQGHMPGRLTEKGMWQAKKLAVRLRDERIDAIFSSDLKRASDTCEEIARLHNAPVFHTPELREVNYGVLEGGRWDDLRRARSESRLHKVDFAPENGESYRRLRERAQGFLEFLFREYKGKTVVVCSHGGFNRMAIGILLKKPIEEAAEIEQHNACLNIIELDDNLQHRAHMINSVEHL
ncbi:histidine phosphatase family protein [Candidatus Woesearchaeota archaeon]|nr:histidine phosphatase family protein [Candidatus Woesearchaeota archaeon]